MTNKIEFYGHVKQYHGLKQEIDEAIHSVLESGAYVLGPQLTKFEEELAQYMNTQQAVGLNSGTDALLLSFLALGIGPGDEVITTANTFFATAEAIWLAGATPVFVDSEPKTRNIDVTKIEAAITPKTRAIVPVHLYGLTADMPAVARIAKAHGLFVVEDCAQAIGARGDTFAIGELSDAVCLSFIIQKNLGCFGDGGAVVTNQKELATSIRRLRNHGSLKRSYHSIGYNSRLDELQAAILRVKLKRVDEWSETRRALARVYDKVLKDAPMALPYTPAGYEHVYHLYVIECTDRDDLQAYLASQGITALTHYPIAIHQQEGFPWGRAAKLSPLPVSERSAATVLSLPMYPELTHAEVERVAEEVLAWSTSAQRLAAGAD
ncbi:MAG TPA: DegT/DnrJ/EryC1/StrS family aminotransferase [Terriglobales bacterium]|nr:DegT/DnrJ/EryC1/StrS family aminotransferase [Terriglobales bacterium]